LNNQITSNHETLKSYSKEEMRKIKRNENLVKNIIKKIKRERESNEKIS